MIKVRIIYDDEYEDLYTSSIRESDDNKYCLFCDSSGVNHDIGVIEAHWHEWLEIIYVLDGTMKIMAPYGLYEVKKGNIVVVGTRTLHKIMGEKGVYRFQCLHVNIGFILQHMNSVLLNDKIFIIKNQELFLEYFSTVIKHMKHHDLVSQMRYKASLINLLSICIEENGNIEIHKEYDNDVFSKILFYVSIYYQKDLSLQELSNHFNYTTQHISLMFKKYLDTNYLTYLTQLRLDRAYFVLMTTQKKIVEIALECGFSNERSFISQFKRVYGDTPSRYRRKSIHKAI